MNRSLFLVLMALLIECSLAANVSAPDRHYWLKAIEVPGDFAPSYPESNIKQMSGNPLTNTQFIFLQKEFLPGFVGGTYLQAIYRGCQEDSTACEPVVRTGEREQMRVLGPPIYGDKFEESNLMHGLSGLIWNENQGYDMVQGEVVRWYLLAMGTEVDRHAAHWHGLTGLYKGSRLDVFSIFRANFVSTCRGCLTT